MVNEYNPDEIRSSKKRKHNTAAASNQADFFFWRIPKNERELVEKRSHLGLPSPRALFDRLLMRNQALPMHRAPEDIHGKDFLEFLGAVGRAFADPKSAAQSILRYRTLLMVALCEVALANGHRVEDVNRVQRDFHAKLTSHENHTDATLRRYRKAVKWVVERSDEVCRGVNFGEALNLYAFETIFYGKMRQPQYSVASVF